MLDNPSFLTPVIWGYFYAYSYVVFITCLLHLYSFIFFDIIRWAAKISILKNINNLCQNPCIIIHCDIQWYLVARTLQALKQSDNHTSYNRLYTIYNIDAKIDEYD